MLLDLSEEHKEHLALLLQVGTTVVAEFRRIAMEFLRRGSNLKIYEGAAQKLNVSSDTIQHGVEGLTYLLTESSKLMVRLLRAVLYHPDPFKLAPITIFLTHNRICAVYQNSAIGVI